MSSVLLVEESSICNRGEANDSKIILDSDQRDNECVFETELGVCL